MLRIQGDVSWGCEVPCRPQHHRYIHHGNFELGYGATQWGTYIVCFTPELCIFLPHETDRDACLSSSPRWWWTP